MMKLGFTRADITDEGRGRQHARPAGASAVLRPHDRGAQPQQQERERLREQRGRRVPLVRREIAEQPRVIPVGLRGNTGCSTHNAAGTSAAATSSAEADVLSAPRSHHATTTAHAATPPSVTIPAAATQSAGVRARTMVTTA